MKHTMLGNPLIRPWEELADITEHFDMQERLFSSYYICRGMKPVARAQATRHDSPKQTVHRLAAE
jgi:hypothetical protein